MMTTLSTLLLNVIAVGVTFAFDHSGEVSSTMSPLLIHSMLEQNKFVRYVESLPVHNTTKNTMMMVARIRKRLPEDNHYNTTTFLSYIAHFDKTYSDEIEAAEKYKNVKYSMEQVGVLQKKNPRAVMGLTKFADITTSQFLAQHTCGKKVTMPKASFASRLEQPPRNLSNPRVRLENTVDWRAKGRVTPVKDQGRCGSCYAFAAVAALESQYAIKTGKMIDLSEQQAISCTYGILRFSSNQGCNGGHSPGVFQYVVEKGITTEANWPYESSDGSNVPRCRGQRSAFHVDHHYQLPYLSEPDMESVIRTRGPIVTYIDAGPIQWYKSGVVSSKGGTITHAVLTVGFTPDYWLIKNSWGADWGEEGYFRVARGVNALTSSEYNYVAY